LQKVQNPEKLKIRIFFSGEPNFCIFLRRAYFYMMKKAKNAAQAVLQILSRDPKPSSRHKMYGSCIFGDNFVGKKVGLRTYKTSRPPENQEIRGIFVRVLSSFEI